MTCALVADDKDVVLSDAQFSLATRRTTRTCGFQRDHLEAFDAAVTGSKRRGQQKVKTKHSGLQLDLILQLGADAAFATPAAQ